MTKIAIFASGSGSNAERIANYFSTNQNVSIETIISNKQDAFVHERAKKLKIPSETPNSSFFKDGLLMTEYLKSKEIDYIILAGFLLKIPKELVDAFPNRIINIHPALLPKFGGKGMYGMNVHKAVIEAHETESGITIHFVNEHYDDGAIIYQAKCTIDPNDTPECLANKIHALEHEYFPQVLERVFQDSSK